MCQIDSTYWAAPSDGASWTVKFLSDNNSYREINDNSLRDSIFIKTQLVLLYFWSNGKNGESQAKADDRFWAESWAIAKKSLVRAGETKKADRVLEGLYYASRPSYLSCNRILLIQYIMAVIDTQLMNEHMGSKIISNLKTIDVKYELKNRPIPRTISWQRSVQQTFVSSDGCVSLFDCSWLTMESLSSFDVSFRCNWQINMKMKNNFSMW